MSGAPIYTATAEEVALAVDWHGGGASMLYAVASAGALSRGTEGYRAGRTDEEWSADLLERLTAEVEEVASSANTADETDDYWTATAWAATLAELAADCAVVGHEWTDRPNGYGWYLCERGTCRAKSMDGNEGDR